MSTQTRRIYTTAGGKGGVGKTTLVTSFIDWHLAKKVDCSILDLDTENKTKGSLFHFYPEITRKVDVSTRKGLDVLIDQLEHHSTIIADMGASSGKVTHEWFDAMHDDIHELNVEFTMIGMITPDPASLESILQWASFLKNRVKYLIVLNPGENPSPDFSLWNDSSQKAKQFREAFDYEVIQMESRIPEIQNLMRAHGVTLEQVASKQTTHVPELSTLSTIIRAQGYRRRIYSEFDRIQQFLAN